MLTQTRICLEVQICQPRRYSCWRLAAQISYVTRFKSDDCGGHQGALNWAHCHVRETNLRWLYFVTGCIIMLKISHYKMANCGHKVMHMVSNDIQIGCGIQTMIDWCEWSQWRQAVDSWPYHPHASAEMCCFLAYCSCKRDVIWVTTAFLLLTGDWCVSKSQVNSLRNIQTKWSCTLNATVKVPKIPF